MKFPTKYRKPALIIGLVLVFLIVVPILTKNRAQGIGELSYLGGFNLPRGMRNNNPGNLRITSIPWLNKIPKNQNTDGSFEQFETYVYGVRAMILDLKNDIVDDNDNTIQLLVYRYAPPSENHTEIYIDYVVDHTGIEATALLTPDKATLKKLVQAMAEYENGRPAVSTAEFNYAYNLL